MEESRVNMSCQIQKYNVETEDEIRGDMSKPIWSTLLFPTRTVGQRKGQMQQVRDSIGLYTLPRRT
jgi:hypothetical protein